MVLTKLGVSIDVRRLRGWRNTVLDQLFPPNCLLCGDRGAPGRYLCDGCLVDLPRNSAYCARCALPLPAPGVCGECLRRPPPYDRVLAPLRYAAPIDHLITGLKFRQQLGVAHLLASLLADHIKTCNGPRPECLIPVPLHGSRLRLRGYNQALEIARLLCAELDIPVDYRACRRIRATPAQSLLPAAERRRNVRGAFQVESHPWRRVAIVDDVMTTGHTVGELAADLGRAGASSVEVWVCARAS
jgi:ComF family protein